MNPFQIFRSVVFLLFIFTATKVEAQRNMLLTVADKTAVGQYLLPKEKWISYPNY